MIDLATLDGTNGFRLDGIASEDYSGYSVSSAGDVNGDGFDDMIVGAPSADPGGIASAGETYVVFGQPGGFSATFELSSLDGSNGFRIEGKSLGEETGLTSSSAGDINGDGFDDLVIGSETANPNSMKDAGEAFVVFGKSSGFSASLSLNRLYGSNGFRINGLAAYDRLGCSVSSAGDFNGDGYDDLLIGGEGSGSGGETYLIFGKSTTYASSLNVATLNGTDGFRLDGIDTSDLAGCSVSSAGDVNGDGFDDLLIGAESADPNGENLAGESYVVFGHSSGFSSPFDLSTLNGANGFRINGEGPTSLFGNSVRFAGDVNGDGFGDIIIGARDYNNGTKSDAGKSYVVFGQAEGFAAEINVTDLDGSNGFQINGKDYFDRFGCSVSSAGDINGDGYDDLIIGAYKASIVGANSEGESYVLYGKASGFAPLIEASSVDGSNGFHLGGLNGSSKFGWSVSSAGDVDGDGFDDIVIGAHGEDLIDPVRYRAGKSFVLLGDNFTGDVETQVGGVGIDVLTAVQGAASTDILIGGQADDILIGDGGPDVLRGGEGDDTLAIPATDFQRLLGGNGFDTLRLDGSGVSLDLTSVPDNKIVDVEQIDITGSGPNTLILNAQEVLNASSHSNTLRILADADDTIDTDSGWTLSGFEGISGRFFSVYTQGAATLQIAGQIDLSTLDGTNGFRLEGNDTYGNSGYSVSSAGDVNGDGFDDMIVGAPDAEPDGIRKAGESYVVFGQSGGYSAAFDVATLDGSNGFRLVGSFTNYYAGEAVSSAGDINGDGYDDLIIGAYGSDPNGYSFAGRAFVVFGQSSGFSSTVDLGSLSGPDGFRLDGLAEGDYLGKAVGSAGDYNGDGYDDLIIGARRAEPDPDSTGEVYVVFGKSETFGAAFDIQTLNGSNGFRLAGEVNSATGSSVTSAGDVNADGYDDLLIGAPAARPVPGTPAGTTYVVFGRPGEISSPVDLTALNGTNGFQMNGSGLNENSGFSVSSAGDFNGDGFDDVVVGAYAANNAIGGSVGETYVVFGKASGFPSEIHLLSLNGTDGFRINGIDPYDNSGYSVSTAGDLNCDGYDDLIIGARHADPNESTNAGESYVVYGQAGTFSPEFNLSTLDGSNGFRLDGIDAFDISGSSVSLAGDVNGDGFSDIIIGAIDADPADVFAAGETYIIFGDDFTSDAETQVGGIDADVITANQGSVETDILIGAQGDDVLVGDGGPDILQGGEGDDTLAIPATDFQRLLGGNGIDTLRLDGADIALDLTSVSDNKIVDIERIDITGSGDNTLTLDLLEVLNISSHSNTLIVKRDAGDTVNQGDGWTQQADELIDGVIYNIFTQDAAELFVQSAAPNPSVIDLSTLNGVNGFRLDGIDASDASGLSVSSAGDVNGDGFDDIIIGAREGDPNGLYDAGESYVVFGQSGGFSASFDLSTLNGVNGFRLDGVEDFDRLSSVSSAGDINGDGFDDLIIGAEQADPGGKAYVLFGKSGTYSATFDLATLDGSNGFRIDGIDEYDHFGCSVSSAGDVNGDGYDDLIIGAYHADTGPFGYEGETYVVFGKSGNYSAVFDLATLDGVNGFRLDGIDLYNFSGFAVSSAGDINGDGFDDLIIGAYGADRVDTNAGETYVVFGKLGGYAPMLDLSTLNGVNGFRLNGIGAIDHSGYSVSSAGDVNGDGFDDLIIGTDITSNLNNWSAGEAYVVFGKSSGFSSTFNLSTLDGANGFRLLGIDRYDRFGSSVSSAGDVNGDGFDDLIIGAYEADPGGESDAGETYIVFGQASGYAAALYLSTLDGSNGFRLDGIDSGDYSGHSVSSTGDVNGDGFDDMIIGAREADSGGESRAGESYVYFGGNFTFESETQIGDDAANTLTAAQGAASVDILIGAQGDDILVGDGGSDVLKGGEGDDTLAVPTTDFQRLLGGNGFDTLRLDGAGIALDLTSVSDNKIVDIEQIDMTGAGDNTLTLDLLEVLNISSHSNTLIVKRDAGDTVNQGGGWTQQADELIDGDIFNVFTQGAAELLVQSVATNPSIIDLSTLDGVNGFRVDGADRYDNSGCSVSSAGDVNGDGYDDIIIGTIYYDIRYPKAGKSYIVFGQPSGFSSALDLSTLDGVNGFRLDGINEGDEFGFSVSSAGDINADGIDDLIIGADEAEHRGQSSAGEAYVVFGHTGEFSASLDISTLDGANGFRLEGYEKDSRTGFSVNSAGDVNGDGLADMIIGTNSGNTYKGKSFIVFGRSEAYPASLPLYALDGSNGFQVEGLDSRDHFGSSASSAGDINSDGFDDLIIGAYDAFSLSGDAYVGETFVILGHSGDFTPKIDLLTLDGSNGFRLDGIDDRDNSGLSVSSAGDFNGDGFDDMIIGAVNANPNDTTYAGESYLVFGSSEAFSASLNLASLNGTNGFQINGINEYDRLGGCVSSAGDVNGDGFDDLFLGAPYVQLNDKASVGASYVLFGQANAISSPFELSTLNGDNGFRLNGIDRSDYSGIRLSSAEDVNGDGFDDMIIGAPGADPDGAYDAGESYVYFGGNFTFGPETQVGDDAANTLTAVQGAASTDILIGAQGDDVLIGDGGPDVLRGGEGDDTLAIPATDFQRLLGGNGIDTLRLDGSGVTLDLTSLSDNKIVDFEQIDITGSGDNTLTLDLLEVLNISSHSNTLTVKRDAGDTVNMGSGWTQQPNERIGAETFQVYTQDLAVLKLEIPATPSDYGDAPDASSGTGAGNYSTTDADNGPSHTVTPGLFMGANVDVDDGTLQNATANADDVNQSLPDDEDGVCNPFTDLTLTIGTQPQVDIFVNNMTGTVATLSGWIDYNADGVFDNATERAQTTVPDGTTNQIFALTFPEIPLGYTGQTYARFRLSTDAEAFNPTGLASDGEVEDYRVSIVLPGAGTVASTTILASGQNGGPTLEDGVNYGSAVCSIGDLDGDGVPDMAVGARLADGEGAVFVQFMNADGTAKESVKISSNFNGGPELQSGDLFGRSVASIGDLDGDGIAELVVGAEGDDTGHMFAGAAYVLFLNRNGTVGNYQKIAYNTGGGPSLQVPNWFGKGIAPLGDLDGDGVNDMVVTASGDKVDGNTVGSAYVLFMNPDGTVKNYQRISHEIGGGPSLTTVVQFGYSITSLGDVDSDGITDIAVGSVGDDTGGTRRGAVYVMFLNRDGTVKNYQKIASETGGGPILTDYTDFGEAVGSPGDLNGDGVPDLLVGVRQDDSVVENGGAVYTILLNVDGTASDFHVLASGTYGLPELSVDNYWGYSVTSLGDLNNDGVSDWAVGAPFIDDGEYRDTVYVMLMDPMNLPPEVEVTNLVASLSEDMDTATRTQVADIVVSDDGNGAPTLNLSGDDAALFEIDGNELYLIAGALLDYNTNPQLDVVIEIDDVAIEGTPDDAAIMSITVLETLAYDYGDAPDASTGTGAGNYNTTSADFGPKHTVMPGIFIGANVDIDDGTLQNVAANADDSDQAFLDDEDGLINPDVDLILTVGTQPTVDIFLTNTTGSPATLSGWIDYNADGVFFNATERAQTVVADGTNAGVVTLTFPVVPEGFTGKTYARFRLSTDVAASDPTGSATDGEVEDYAASIFALASPFVTDTVKIAHQTNGGPYLFNFDYYGGEVVAIGDMDGDGTVDMAVGATGDDTTGKSHGAVYIQFMNPDATVKSYTKITEGINGGPALVDYAGFGSSIAPMGDLDGNGVVDLAVGARYEDAGGSDRGAVFILFMNADGSASNTVRIAGGVNGGPVTANGDHFGRSLEIIGDLNRDGVVDLAVGADGDDTGGVGRGAVHILFMNSDGTVQSSQKITDGVGGGPALWDEGEFGSSIAALGDLDGDGVTEIAAGEIEGGPGIRPGAVHVMFMNVDGTVKSITKIGHNVGGGPNLNNYDLFGRMIEPLGDLNGDGIVDIAVGAMRDDTGENDSGAVHLLLLNSNGTVKSSSKIGNDLRGGPILASGDSFGNAITNLGDINGDGIIDLVVGAWSEDTGGASRGALYVLSLSPAVDFGDAPDASIGTEAGNYNTTAEDYGPSHTITQALYMGTTVDGDDGTLQDVTANADDVNPSFSSDEDGLTNPTIDLVFSASEQPTIDVNVTNTTGAAATLFGWIDYNTDGIFDNTTERTQVAVPDGTNGSVATLAFPTAPENYLGETFARFRLSTDAAAANPTGAASDGEVEDYIITMSNKLYLQGTSENDSVRIWPGTPGETLHRIDINGVTNYVDASLFDELHFDGLGGNDGLSIYGKETDENVTFNAKSVQMSESSVYGIYAENIWTCYIYGGGGTDAATIVGSASDDNFYINQDYSYLRGDFVNNTTGFLNFTKDFSSVTVDASTSGGTDRVYMYDGPGDDILIAGETQMTVDYDSTISPGVNVTAIGFGETNAYAVNGGNDVATLAGSAGNDKFTARDLYGRIAGNDGAYIHYAEGFDQVTGDASGTTGTDVANLFDGIGDDRLQAGETSAAMDLDATPGVDDFDLIANGFDQTYAYAIRGGNDSATMTGSTNNDRFTSKRTYSTLKRQGGSYFNYASGFENVTADVSGGGGIDLAFLYDDTTDDAFTAGPTQATFDYDQPGSPGVDTTIVGFSNVYAYAIYGGNDIAILNGSAGADKYYGLASYSYLKTVDDSFFNYVRGFDAVTANAVGTGDLAFLYDSDGNDVLSASPNSATFTLIPTSGGQVVNTAAAFDQVYGYASGEGTDTAHLYGTTGPDRLTADADWGILRSKGSDDYLNYIRYFDEVFADPGDDELGNDLLDDRGATYALNTDPGNGNVW
jgi:hypothetical protein